MASGTSSPSFYQQFDRGFAFVLLCTSGKVCGLVVATSEEKSWGVENRRCGQQHPYPLCARPRETPVIRGDEGTIIVSTCAEIRVLLYDQKAEFGYRARASLRGPEHHMLGIMGAVA